MSIPVPDLQLPWAPTISSASGWRLPSQLSMTTTCRRGLAFPCWICSFFGRFRSPPKAVGVCNLRPIGIYDM